MTTTREALLESIEHWKNNVAAAEPSEVHLGPSVCALCEAFRDIGSETAANDCAKCPVKQKTGSQYCENSPYIEASRAAAIWKLNPTEENKIIWISTAQAELDFLRDLL